MTKTRDSTTSDNRPQSTFEPEREAAIDSSVFSPENRAGLLYPHPSDRREQVAAANESSHDPIPFPSLGPPDDVSPLLALHGSIAEIHVDNEHLEVWDVKENSYVVFPAELHIQFESMAACGRAGRLRSYTINLCCRTVGPPRWRYELYAVSYAGHDICESSLWKMKHAHGIHMEHSWRVASLGGEEPPRFRKKLWIPLPAELFARKETRACVIHAWVERGEGLQPLEASRQISVTVLRSQLIITASTNAWLSAQHFCHHFNTILQVHSLLIPGLRAPETPPGVFHALDAMLVMLVVPVSPVALVVSNGGKIGRRIGGKLLVCGSIILEHIRIRHAAAENTIWEADCGQGS